MQPGRSVGVVGDPAVLPDHPRRGQQRLGRGLLDREARGQRADIEQYGRGTPDDAQVFSETAEEIRRLLHQFAAGFLKEVEGAQRHGQDIPFEGDPDRLRQVIINLVGNALKAGARTITLESTPQENGQEVRLSIHDDGPGIPPEHLERLFDRFYRVEDSRSRDQGGAGLGLSIAKGIVDAHSGRIWLESEVGRGTVAHVQLPVGDVPLLDEEDVP